MTEKKNIILFDGICNLCTWIVQFVLKRDPKGFFVFASIQSPKGSSIYRAHGFRPEDITTFVLIEDNRSYSKSEAAIRVARRLSGFWGLLTLIYFIPRPIRNWCYDIVAKNRYRWFGKTETCLIPSKEHLERFIS